jgi:glycogen operon protein
MADLVSYSEKHNEANGENNRDGHNHNSSWNCGVEGPTDDPAINAARTRDVRALLATLFFSRGIPMIQQGDELGRTQRGNNNAYAQDNEITWLDWEGADGARVDFVSALHAFRKAHEALTHDHFLTGQARQGVRDVVWLHPDGREMSEGDWHDAATSVLGMQLATARDEVLVWFNRRVEQVSAKLPAGNWAVGLCSDDQVEVPVAGGIVRLPARSVVALVRAPAATEPKPEPTERPASS